MIPLVAPCITDIDLRQMRNAVSLGLLDHGLREVERFEEAFAARVGCEWAVAVSSGTNALALAVAMLPKELAGPVRIASYGCVAVLNGCERHGHGVTFRDSTWDVASAISISEPVDVRVHLFGRSTFTIDPAPSSIEDWTLSLGDTAKLEGRLGVCSTHADKMISTGRGGVIFGNDPYLEAPARNLSHYDNVNPARHGAQSLAMSSMQAALGNSQLAQLDAFIERRRELAGRYTDAFRAAGIECPDADCGSVFFRYLIATKKPWEKVARLAARGIEAGRGVYPPLHQLAGLPDDAFPGTMQAVNSLLSVPVHPSITDEQAAHIIESVLEVCAP